MFKSIQIKGYTFLLFLYILFLHYSQAANDDTPASKKILRMDGDIIIGALFPVHRAPSLKTAYTRQCGEFWEQYGMHRIETFVYTLNAINDDQNLLPNITLGCDIRDSCWYTPVALEQSIDFIKNSIASIDREINKTIAGQCDAAADSQLSKPIAGLIGPGSSSVSIQVQNLLQLFNIPQIGYSATSKDLSNKGFYKYFMRVVPPDTLQAQALADLVKRYNWTYISTVYTEGNYGQSGMETFKKIIAKDTSICIATEDKVANNAEDEAYDSVINNLRFTRNAEVVICFCEGKTMQKLFAATRRFEVVGKFLFIGSDGWNDRLDVVEGNEEEASGGISIRLHSPQINYFDEYYGSLKPFNNTWNPWFKQFWQWRFKCYLDGAETSSNYSAPCTGNENLLLGNYKQDAKLGFVINAIYTMAYALHGMHQDICKGRKGLCSAMDPINGSVFLDYLHKVNFTTYSNSSLHFDPNGDPPGRYDIMNYQRTTIQNGSSYDYVQVGSWDTGTLTMQDNIVQWASRGRGINHILESVCSKPCPKGQIKKYSSGGQKRCCWNCQKCSENAILLDEETCHKCSLGWWPNEDLSACMPIPIEHMKWSDTEAVVSMAISICGVIMTAFTSVVFIRYHDTPIVKASTKELSYIILVGILLAYITTFTFVAKPSIVSCYLGRILPGVAFSMIYGALVTKTNRIARILAGSKKKILTRKPRFMSASAQVIITLIIIGGECVIITAILIWQPADSTLDYPNHQVVKLVCNTTLYGLVVPLGFDFILIIFCTMYAVKTRNLPENFNESKFIGFSMYTTCIVWIAFVPIYFGSDSKVVTMCLAISFCATVALILLFWPKVYIIVWKPEKNQRSAFTTSKDIRCHIGSQISKDKSTESMDRFERSGFYSDKSPFRPRFNTADFPSSGKGRYTQETKNNSKMENNRLIPSFSRFSRQNSVHVPDRERYKQANGSVTNENREKIRLGPSLSNISEAKTKCEERGVQTGEELLHSLVSGLRKRRSHLASGSLERVGSDASLNSRTSDEFFITEPLSRSTGGGTGCHNQNNILHNHRKQVTEKDLAEDITPLLTNDNFLLSPNMSISSSRSSSEKRRAFCEMKNIATPVDGVSMGTSVASAETAVSTISDNLESGEGTNASSPLLVSPNIFTFSGSKSTPSFTIPGESKFNDNGIVKTKSSGYIPEIQVDLPRPNSQTNLLDCVENDIPNSTSSGLLWASTGGSLLAPSVALPSQSINDDMSWESLKMFDEEEDSVYQFQEYLKSKGLDLDLNAIQSSDV